MSCHVEDVQEILVQKMMICICIYIHFLRHRTGGASLPSVVAIL